jgi:DNA-binding NtrC family response regulator
VANVSFLASVAMAFFEPLSAHSRFRIAAAPDTFPARMKSRILLIEDDSGITVTLQRLLANEGYEVAVEKRGDSGLARARAEDFDVVLSDLKLPGLSGLDLVRELHEAKPRLPIVLMTAHGTTETAIEATKRGAFDYLLKPFEMPDLLEVVSKALMTSRLMSEPVNVGTVGLRGDTIIGTSRGRQAGERAHPRRDRHRQGADRARAVPA